jgi:hypothetical protein
MKRIIACGAAAGHGRMFPGRRRRLHLLSAIRTLCYPNFTSRTGLQTELKFLQAQDFTPSTA